MELTNETLYQIVRILFALSLLGFLFLVIKVTMKELQQSGIGSIRGEPTTLRAELLAIAQEEGSSVREGTLFEVKGVTTIGRADSSHIVLNDTSVSAHHALMRPSEGTWSIEDLGSRNGTLVNGRPISSQTALECGDAVQLGRVRLRLMC